MVLSQFIFKGLLHRNKYLIATFCKFRVRRTVANGFKSSHYDITFAFISILQEKFLLSVGKKNV